MARLRVALPWSLLLLLALALLPWSSAAHAQANCAGTDPRRDRYSVKIESAPPGAAIYINDKACPQIGTTPWEGKLNAGDYSVLLDAPGYDLAVKPLRVGKVRRPQELFVPMVRKLDPPRIDVRADADPNVVGATVTLDGQPVGPAPLVLVATPGRHLVAVKKDGFAESSQWIEVKENQVQTFSPAFAPAAKEPVAPATSRYGTVVVDADVADAEVFLDGNKHPDSTPAVISNVIEGVHVIEVRKAPGAAWKQTIDVKSGQQTKVRAELAGSVSGVIHVLSDAQGARAFIDGTDMGPVPIDIKDVRPGDHVVQVKAPGFQAGERHVNVAAGGTQTVKVDLTAEVAAVDPGAAAVDPGAVKVAPGAAKGEPGPVKAVGRLRVIASPPQAHATVLINGVASGATPLDTEVEVGENVVRIEAPGYQAFEQTVTIQNGKTETLSRSLVVAGPSKEDKAMEQRGLSSFGARVLPRGHSTVDVDVGYPYFTTARVTVGAGQIPNLFGFDASVAARTMLARTELGLGGRMTLIDNEPFAAAAFTNLWWGSRLFDDSKRNGFTADLGGAVSLIAASHATLTGRAYAELWTDRHCPALDPTQPNGFEGTDPLQVCIDAKNHRLSRADEARVVKLFGSDAALFDRENGARFMLSLIGELAFQQDWNVYFILEGAPFQDAERPLFTSLFSGTMADTDYRLYLRVGLTYKF